MSSTEDKTPDQIREEIEQTRAELGDTVEALGAKTDVKGRADAKVEEIKGNVRESVQDAKANAKAKLPGGGGNGSGPQPGSPQEKVQAAGQQAVATAKSNPLPLAVAGALLLGFLIGRRAAR